MCSYNYEEAGLSGITCKYRASPLRWNLRIRNPAPESSSSAVHSACPVRRRRWTVTLSNSGPNKTGLGDRRRAQVQEQIVPVFPSAVTCEMNDASHNHGEQENTVSTYSIDVETLKQIALKGDASRHCSAGNQLRTGARGGGKPAGSFLLLPAGGGTGPRYRPAQSGDGPFNGIGAPQDNDKAFLLVPVPPNRAPHRAI